MAKSRTIGIGTSWAAQALVALVLLYVSSLYSHQLYHSLLEVASVAISWSLFVVYWNSRDRLANGYFVTVGVAGFFIGGIDLIHTLAYQGIAVFPGLAGSPASTLWAMAGLMQSLALLLAPIEMAGKARPRHIFLGFALVSTLLLGAVLLGAFPAGPQEGAGITRFTRVSEGVVALILLASVIPLLRNRRAFDAEVFRFLVISTASYFASALALNLYPGDFMASNMVAHLLKMVAALAMYKALVEAALTRPHLVLFRELKRSEDLYHQQRDFAENIITTAQVIILVLDTDGRIVSFNPYMEQLSGCRLEEVAGKDWFSAFLPIRDHVRILQVFRGSFEGKQVIGNLNPILTKDGRERMIEWTGTTLTNAEGVVTGTLSVGVDVTERLRAEETLRESEERYRTLFDEARDGMVLSDAETGLIVDCNAAFQYLAGRDLEQLKGIRVWELRPPEMREPARKTFLRVVDQGSVSADDLILQRPDGSTVPVELVAKKVTIRGRELVQSVVRDISERRQAEAELRALARFPSENPNPVLRVDIEGSITYANAASAPLLAAWQSAVGQYLPPGWRAIPAESFASGAVSTYEYEHEGRVLSLTFAPLSEEERINIYAHDITQRFQAQRALQEANDDLERRVLERTSALARLNEALQESQERFRSLFEYAPLCVFEIDFAKTPFVIRRANRRAEQVYGWSAQELICAIPDSALPPEAAADLARLIGGLHADKLSSVESVHRRRDGSAFPVRVSAALERESDLRSVIVAVEDISLERQRRSEEEAIAAERMRIAREIHDGLAQDLASLRLRARLWYDLIERDPEHLRSEIDTLRELLSKNIDAVRRSIFALRPVELEELGFWAAIETLALDFGELQQLSIHQNVLGPREALPRALEAPLFRIIQEALSNIVRHAQAHAVWVDLDLATAKQLSLTVRDDGQGFDVSDLEHALRHGHLGLTQMRERVRDLGGDFALRSDPVRGTEIEVVLPTQ